MPVLEETQIPVSTPVNSRKRWTVDEAAKLTELFPAEHYELIEGDLISEVGQRPPHGYVIRMLNELLAGFSAAVGFRFSLPFRSPIQPDNTPSRNRM